MSQKCSNWNKVKKWEKKSLIAKFNLFLLMIIFFTVRFNLFNFLEIHIGAYF